MDEQKYQTNSSSEKNPLKKIMSIIVIAAVCFLLYNFVFTSTIPDDTKKEQAFSLADNYAVSELSKMGFNVYYETKNDMPIYTVKLDKNFQLVSINYIVNSDKVSDLGNIYITYSAKTETEFSRSGHPSGSIGSSTITTSNGTTFSMKEFEDAIDAMARMQAAIDGLDSIGA